MSMETQNYTIESCKHCGGNHSFRIRVEKQAPLFGGPEAKPESKKNTEWTFTCPQTNQPLFRQVRLPAGSKMMGIIPLDESATEPAENNAQYETWINSSRDRALSFSTTMLSTCTAAIGVYFTIQKYVGSERLERSRPDAVLSIMPPFLYLGAAIFFILALQPRFGWVAPSEFHHFRVKVFTAMNTRIRIGVVLFVVATGAAIVRLFTFST